MGLCSALLLWIGVIMPKDLITVNNVNIQPLMESLDEVDPKDLLRHLQSDIGYIMKRLGLM